MGWRTRSWARGGGWVGGWCCARGQEKDGRVDKGCARWCVPMRSHGARRRRSRAAGWLAAEAGEGVECSKGRWMQCSRMSSKHAQRGESMVGRSVVKPCVDGGVGGGLCEWVVSRRGRRR